MSKELFCEAVIDLLPSYIDGLTSPETNKAMEAHFIACEDCKKRKAAMAGDNEPVTDSPAKEIDYLKAVRRKSRKKVALGIVIALFLVLLAGSVKVFLIGWPVYSVSYQIYSTGTGDEIVINGYIHSGQNVRNVSISHVEGNTYLTVYGCLPSFLTERVYNFYYRIPAEGIDRIYLGKANDPKETMWLKGTYSSAGQHTLTNGNVKAGEFFVFDSRLLAISSKHSVEISYNIAWTPAKQAVEWYLINTENGTETCVATERGGNPTGTLDFQAISDGKYYLALRNSGDKLEQPDTREIYTFYVQMRYIEHIYVN